MDKEKEYQDLYDKIVEYESLCWDIYNQVKEKCEVNQFTKSIGQTLFKYRKLKPKQLIALMNMLEKVKGG